MLDVCLIVEGTYPYVPGGVSAWVNDLIEALSALRFGVVHVGPGGDVARKPFYPLHDNVQRFVEVFIHDEQVQQERTAASPAGVRGLLGLARRRRQHAFARLERTYEELLRRPQAVVPAALDEALEILAGQGRYGLAIRDVLGSHESWDLIARMAERHGPEESFVDFFWTARFTHLPLLRLLRAPVPRAAVYHSVTTGYAGFLAAWSARRRGAPLVLTEHGIYTRERQLEIQRATWIRGPRRERLRAERSLGLFKQWWAGLFELLGRYAYQQATEIVTLFEGNRRLQIEGGAPAERCLIIPNGVDLERFAGRRARGLPLERKAAPHVALVGRVVPIKDVKTFLRAARQIADALHAVQIEVVGPTDEDEAYFADCLHEARLLGLQDVVRFRGTLDTAELLERLDCLVLTSISEGQPLVLLEAMAAGVPVVATDVGACRELIEGSTAADRALGPSGLVCPVADAEAVARAVLRCLGDATLRARMAAAGLERVRRYYRRERVHALYEEIYRSYRDRYLGGERFVEPASGWGSFARSLGPRGAAAMALLGGG
ncbi:MAG: pellicle/biofilm biosynthesis glycosyltransferase PelF [Planctomycetota bacterium]|nr:MAG: pellicle/biofilm biosynthesis glycosyltransferase PelF [Planctomycetota bacterium]